MKTIVVTQREIQEAMKRSVYVNKKKYTRKTKHKKYNLNTKSDR